MPHSIIDGLIDLVYPKKCLACKNRLGASSVDNLICAACWNNIKRNTPPFCCSCGRKLAKPGINKNLCPGCLRQRAHFDRAFSPCVYTGAIKELIHEFKYNGKPYLGAPLSRLMIQFIKEYDLPIGHLDFIVPVPLHKIKLREREFNQAEILSRHIAEEFNKSLLTDCLRRHRHTKTQAELEINNRLLNVKDSFSVADCGLIKNKNLLVIDDVLTTGATASEAAGALKNAGAGIVFVLALAN